jgi:hypothetical protein
LLLLLLVPDLDGQRGASDEAHQREGGVDGDAPKVATSEVSIRRSGASRRRRRSPWCPTADRGGGDRGELGVVR